MNLQITLFKILLKYEEYHRCIGLIDLAALKENYRELAHCYAALKELRENVPDKDFTLDEFIAYFRAKYPELPGELYESLFSQMREANVSEEVGLSVLNAVARREGLLSLSQAAYEAAEGRGSLDTVRELVEALDKPKKETVDDTCFITTDISEIVGAIVEKPGIRWHLQCLNKALGSLRSGDFGFIFARPETGKTTFIAHTVSEALRQVDRPVIWVNNEEQDSKVMLRVVQSYFGIPIHELLSNVKRYNALFNERVGGKFLLVNSSRVDITRDNIERILAARSPSLIIYDQIDKIKGFKADRDDLTLGAIYQWARELAKQYAPTIGVCQSDGSGEGQKWLTMANVANAKTSKQAEADFIIGIGKTHDEATEAVRYINISKNKLMGDPDSDPSLRHARLEVIIQPDIARYKDVINYG